MLFKRRGRERRSAWTVDQMNDPADELQAIDTELMGWIEVLRRPVLGSRA